MKFLEPDLYQPVAAATYGAIADRLRAVLPNATIEHIGSSAIPGVISKGDLDVFVGVDAKDFSEAIGAIERLGFQIKRDTLRTEQLCPFVGANFPLEVGIQLVERGSRFEFFRRFRDQLNRDAVLRGRYNQLKYESTSLDESEYRVRKSAFIENILAVSAKSDGPDSRLD